MNELLSGVELIVLIYLHQNNNWLSTELFLSWFCFGLGFS